MREELVKTSSSRDDTFSKTVLHWFNIVTQIHSIFIRVYS